MKKRFAFVMPLMLSLMVGIQSVPAYALFSSSPEACQSLDVSAYHYEIERTGTVAPNIDVFTGAVYDGDFVYATEGDQANLLGPEGKIIAEDIIDCRYIGDGLYVVTANSTSINRVGLVDAEGNVLIPYDAADVGIKSSAFHEDAGRYIPVKYVTGTADSPGADGFILSVKDREGKIVYCTGYIKVYDALKRRFVEGVETTYYSSLYDDWVVQCGSSVLVQMDRATRILYDEDGNELITIGDRDAVCMGTHILYKDGNQYVIIDEEGMTTCRTEKKLTALSCISHDGSDEYCYYKEGDTTFIVNAYGDIVFSSDEIASDLNKHGSPFCNATGDLFRIKKDESYKEYLVDRTGREVFMADQDEGYDSLIITFGRMWATVNPYNEIVLIDANGVHNLGTRGSANFAEDLLFTNDADQIFTFANYEFTKKSYGWYSGLDIGLIAVEGDNGLYGLFDVFSGEELLPTQYRGILYGGDCVFAMNQNREWEVYRTSLVEEEREDPGPVKGAKNINTASTTATEKTQKAKSSEEKAGASGSQSGSASKAGASGSQSGSASKAGTSGSQSGSVSKPGSSAQKSSSGEGTQSGSQKVKESGITDEMLADETLLAYTEDGSILIYGEPSEFSPDGESFSMDLNVRFVNNSSHDLLITFPDSSETAVATVNGCDVDPILSPAFIDPGEEATVNIWDWNYKLSDLGISDASDIVKGMDVTLQFDIYAVGTGKSAIVTVKGVVKDGKLVCK